MKRNAKINLETQIENGKTNKWRSFASWPFSFSMQQVERLEDQLQQSSQLNSKLKNQLEDASHSSLQSINSKDTLIRSQADEIKNLKNQLDKARRTLGELELRLNDASNKMDRYADDLGRLDRDEALLEREHEIETLKLEVQELRRRTGNDMAAQTSPARNWGEAAGQEEQLRSELAESRQVNEHYKKLLDEKNNDLQRLRRVGGLVVVVFVSAFCTFSPDQQQLIFCQL